MGLIHKSLRWGVYGPYAQTKCLLKNLDFWKKNIFKYSNLKFQLYEPHSLTVIGLKSGQKSINLVSGHFRVFKVTLEFKLQASIFSQRKRIEIICNTV